MVNGKKVKKVKMGNTEVEVPTNETGNVYGDALGIDYSKNEPIYGSVIGNSVWGTVENNSSANATPSNPQAPSMGEGITGTPSNTYAEGIRATYGIESAPPTTTYADGIASYDTGNATRPSRPRGVRTDVGTSDTGTTDTGTVSPMTYESWINEQKKLEEEKYLNSMKEAEKYRERASADAQASYLQNMSTYGINAETMSQMGLTGGGYSDYLNSQAYAQQRSDMQTAEKNALAMEQQANTTYQDAIAQLNQESTTAYTKLLENAQNPNTYGNYTEEGIRAMANQFGWSDTQTQEAINVWKQAKESAELAMGESGDTIVMDDIIKSVQNGEFVNETGQPYSWEEIKEMLYRERNNGATVTDEDIEKAKQAYDVWISYKNGKITSDEYYNALNGDTTANEQVSNATNAEVFKAEAKNQVGEMLGYAEGKYDKYNAVSIYSSSYKASDFGKYVGVNNSSSKQSEYIQKIVDDAKANKIPVGSVVRMNYGVGDIDASNYIYMGKGVFVELPLTYADAYPESKNFSTYVPDGYKKNLYGNIQKE